MIPSSQHASRFPRTLLLVSLFWGTSGCSNPPALGGANQILVVAPESVWQELEPDIKEALEPSTFTVRDERVFEVAHTDPSVGRWENLRVMRQLLLIGTAEDPIIAEALQEYRGAVPAPPAVVQVRNVWAQNQLVTIALVSPGYDPAEVRALLPSIGETFLRQFEEYARARMFVTRPNVELADSLRQAAGFSIVVPQVYRYREVEPGVIVLRNDQPDPSSLIRNVTVTSKPSGEVEFSSESARVWREELAARTTTPPQVTEVLPEWHQIQIDGRNALQIQGIWSNPPGQWPAAGPFMSRLVDCGDRVFLIDAWLYAPGAAKYEYMFQLNTVLNSFECAQSARTE